MVRGLIGKIYDARDGRTTAPFEVSFGLGRKEQARKSDIYVPLSRRQLRKMAEFERKLFNAFQQTHDIKLKEVETGRALLHIDHDNKVVNWSAFFPFTQHAGTIEAQPRKLGVGAQVHHAIVMHLLKLHPDYSIKHASNPYDTSEERKAQLRAMGIDYRKTYTLPEYAKLSRAYLIRLRQRQAMHADGFSKRKKKRRL